MPVRSPTARLLLGSAFTLLLVLAFSWYTLHQVNGLRELQAERVDRNRRNSLQLLRIQNNLNLLATAMRDLLSGEEPYPLAGYAPQFHRLRADLEDALRKERQLAPVSRNAAQQALLTSLLQDFWATADRLFRLAREGQERAAREIVRTTLEPKQTALTAAVARLLVSNNEGEEQAGREIESIYDGVEETLYRFLAATLALILATSLALVYFNRRMFQEMALLSAQKTTLARQLIGTQEEVLRSISRELHDEFGQILTAMGAMIGRVGRKTLPPDSPIRAELQEIRGVAQEALEKTRSLSQMLHPGVLDDYGLQRALEWYVQTFAGQAGLTVHFAQQGICPPLPADRAIHIYRIVQEALSNVARHAGTQEAWVRVRYEAAGVHVAVEDQGTGIAVGRHGTGLGLVAMRERAELLRGRLLLQRPPAGGTLVALDVPLP